MKIDTEKFLETLLFVTESDNASPARRRWTTHEFHPEFIKAAEGFVGRFFDYLSAHHPDIDPDAGERSFGGNVYASLSGAGIGFCDDQDSDWADEMTDAIQAFSKNRYRFESIDLMKFHGKIHLAYRTAAYRAEYLAKMFTV